MPVWINVPIGKERGDTRSSTRSLSSIKRVVVAQSQSSFSFILITSRTHSPCQTTPSLPSPRTTSSSSCTCKTDVSSGYGPSPNLRRLDHYSHILDQYDPLVQPALLRHEITPTEASRLTIATARYNAARVLAGQDERVLVIVGPCSIHSPEQAIEYAKLLGAKIPTWENLVIVMRAYL